MTTSEVLERAAALIEPDGAWTQGWWARDAAGQNIPAMWPSAVCWCMDGAVKRACDDSDASYARADHVLWSIVGDSLTFNDAPGRTQREVVEALRAAALAARQETP